MKYKYALDDKPPLGPLLLYGLQWLLITIPVILTSTVVARFQYEGLADQIFYTQKLFGVIGLGLIAQVLWGHRMPLVMGPASVLLVGVMAVISSSPAVVYTSIVIGGALLALLAASRLLERIQFLFTPRIVIVILALIAFTLAPVIIGLVFGHTPHPLFAFAFTLLLALAMATANDRLSGIWKSAVVPLAMLLGTIVYGLRGGFPTTGAEAGAPTAGFLLQPFEFDAGVLLAFLFCYIVLLINELGSVQSVGQMLGVADLTRRAGRSVGVTGLFNMAAGAVGVLGPVDYSLSPGVIAATGCASRYTLLPAGLGLIACACSPTLVGYLSLIPSTVMGAVLLYLMGTQLAAAMQMLGDKSAVRSFNDGLTVGLPLMLALFLAFLPQGVAAAIPVLVRPILGNAFVMGVIAVLLLEHIIFRHRT